MNALGVLILVVSLFLGGGATVAAAQDDLPNQPLYQLKLWTEDATLALNSDPQEQASLLINMAQTRVEEMAALSEMGLTPPDQVRKRLEEHLYRALVLAADMDETTREQVLLQLRDRLQTHDRTVQLLQTNAGTKSEPVLTQTRQMLHTNLNLVNEGITDPQGFRDRIKNQMQLGQGKEVNPEANQPGEPAGGPGNGNGNDKGNDSPGNPNPDKPQNGNGGNGTGNESPGDQNPNKSKDGNCSGTNCDGENGGGGNK